MWGLSKNVTKLPLYTISASGFQMQITVTEYNGVPNFGAIPKYMHIDIAIIQRKAR